MTTNRQVPYRMGDHKKQSYSGRLHQRLYAAMQDGTAAADILPLMTRELADDGLGAVDIGVVDITR